MVSDTPVDGRCNHEYSSDDDSKHDSGYCEGHPMDNGLCYHHGGKHENGSPPESNQNAKTHGAFSEHFRSDLTESEEEALQSIIDGLEDVTGPRAIPAEVAAEALMKYKRSADSRFLREARQWMSDFNLAPNEDVLEHRGEGGGPLDIAITREVVDGDD